MAQINNSLIPLVIGDNLNEIILGYKYESYSKIVSTIKRQKKYYLTAVDEITNLDIINNMNKIIVQLDNLALLVDYKLNEIKEVMNNI